MFFFVHFFVQTIDVFVQLMYNMSILLIQYEKKLEGF